VQLLVAAVRVDGGTTSEGSCTARVVRLLVERGHQVRLLVGAAGPRGSGAEVARAAVGVPLDVVEVATSASRWSWLGQRAARVPTRYRPDLPVQVATGFGLEELAATAAWRAALLRHEAEMAPDATIVRGAGLDVHPLLARCSHGGPWVAHLHDPWPISWYPASYASRSRLVSARQEVAARRILRSAPAVTAPSARLLDWTAGASGVDLGDRGHVVAHLGPPAGRRSGAAEPVAGLLPDRPFVLCHAGTLLGPRDPRLILAAVERVRRAEPAAREQLGLAFVGALDRRHHDDASLAALVQAGREEGWLALHDGRVALESALATVASAQVGVVIEADDPLSPFFPAKLADLLGGGGPVLALSPRRSAAADLLGSDHPLRVDPGDVGAVAIAVERAWRAWRAGDLDDLRPPEASRALVAGDVVGPALEAAVAAAIEAGQAGVSRPPGG